ncbi:hypothetical protein D1007_42738 [Hordeum vulgare]|nr:hypothetical protein D1007_42738 [Hordeum vulgare]
MMPTINGEQGSTADVIYLLDRLHLPLEPELEDNEVIMDDNDPSSAASRMAAEAEAARNRPPPVPQLITQAEEMAFLVIYVQGMEKNIQEILQSEKIHERVMETKFHDMYGKVPELTTKVKQLQHEVDSVEILRSGDKDDHEEESSPPTTTRFSTKPRSTVVLS